MKTIQIVLDKKLLPGSDRAARRAKRNRSALVRDALRAYLRTLEVRDKERHDRQGYWARPEARNESNDWEAGAQAYGKQKAKIQVHAKVGRIPLSP